MSDNHNVLNCPACNKEMKKVFVPKEGVNIDICIDGCGGMWFDNREIKEFDEQNEKVDEIIAAIEGKEFDKVDQTNHRSCPACGAKMVKNFSSVKKEIQIDECYACGGKFLDNTELQALRAEYATESERSSDMVSYMYATVGADLKKLDKEVAELRANRSWLKKLFDKMVMG